MDDKNKNEVEQLTKKLDKQQGIIDLLLKVADKGQLARLQDKEDMPMVVKLNLYKNQVIKSWELVDDRVKKGGEDSIESQVVQYNFFEGESVTMPYGKSVRETKKEPVEVKETTAKKVDGETILLFKVVHKGKTYEIDSRFVN